MSIIQIEIQERIWNEEKQHYELKYKTITRDEYAGDFDTLILENMSASDIKDYAKEELDLKEYSYCDCRIPALDDFPTEDLVCELESQGFKVIPCQTIVDDMKLQKLKEIMEIQ